MMSTTAHTMPVGRSIGKRIAAAVGAASFSNIDSIVVSCIPFIRVGSFMISREQPSLRTWRCPSAIARFLGSADSWLYMIKRGGKASDIVISSRD